ncbi:hypothetical protein BGX38DRAFT_1141827 [Terfezia claveryi]|nr:hypothetical protein BGX38DRAFT_1141827 [Terfezia claveryi]
MTSPIVDGAVSENEGWTRKVEAAAARGCRTRERRNSTLALNLEALGFGFRETPVLLRGPPRERGATTGCDPRMHRNAGGRDGEGEKSQSGYGGAVKWYLEVREPKAAPEKLRWRGGPAYMTIATNWRQIYRYPDGGRDAPMHKSDKFTCVWGQRKLQFRVISHFLQGSINGGGASGPFLNFKPGGQLVATLMSGLGFLTNITLQGASTLKELNPRFKKGCHLKVN